MERRGGQGPVLRARAEGRILTLDTPAALKKSLPGAQVLDLWMRAPQPLAPRLREVPGVLNLEPVEAGGEDGVERLRLFVDPADGLLDRVLHAVRDGGADLHHVNLAQPILEARLERARGSLHRGRVRTGPETGAADPSGPGRTKPLRVTGYSYR